MTEPKPNPTETAAALAASLHRLNQIARHHVPQFVALARGVNVVQVRAGAPGANVVARLLGLVLLAEAQMSLVKVLLVEAGVIDAQDFDARLAVAVEGAAERLAQEINDNTGGDFLTSFAFAPAPAGKEAA